MLGGTGLAGADAGFDLLAKVLPDVLRNDVQVALHVKGDEALVGVMGELSERWPDRFQVRSDGEDRLDHRIVAGSNLMVVPARRAPSGFVQMYAHRYGTLPIVRRTGGLADTVVDCDAALSTGSGFVYEDATTDDLLAAIRRGLGAYARRDAFAKASQRVMRLDHSWERSARLYERVYKDANLG